MRNRRCEPVELSTFDKQIINRLQHGLPVVERPFLEIAEELGCSEDALMERLQVLLDEKVLSRFGPMFDAACLGGAFTLAALSVPEESFEQVTEQVNSFEEVAHNYKRNHDYNMWFVVGTEAKDGIEKVIKQIEDKTGFPVLNVPKLEEFYVGLYFNA